MDVKSLCLGALTFGDATGYDIKKFFECTFSHFFVAGYGSIYPALATLTEEGLVTCHSEPQEGKPDRKVYSLTGEGREAFVGDLAKTPPNHKVRSEFLVQMYFAHLLPRETLRGLMDERLKDFEESLSRIEEFERELDGEECSLTPGMRFCAGYGRAVMTAGREFMLQRRDEILASGAEDRVSSIKEN